MSVKCYTTAELAGLLDASLAGSAELQVSGIATLAHAQSDQLSFFHNAKYMDQLDTTNAGVILVKPEHVDHVSGVALIVADPYLAYAKASALFANISIERTPHQISSSAVVAVTAQVGTRVQLSENVVVGEHVVIADDVVIGANTVIGDNCIIGSGARIAANVVLYSKVSLGEHCVVHSGAVLGADGFGFANDRGRWVKIHQLGGVVIGNNVEIGAGTTIDRGALDDTVISDGVILDNQIQIAHNVFIGENTAIAGCTAVAGSTRIGSNCTIAGGCGITGHLVIADGTHITAMSLVSKSLKKAGVYSSGTVVEPHQQWKRNVVRFRQLDDVTRRLKKLESIVKQQNTEGQSE
ncbi:MAG: UDP-3-O-(3-hydroxymyristoyl)glucosamine N-acyltransferase [Amphritea sp.]